jgi:hypothetical protein
MWPWVLLLITVTSIAVIAYFRRHRYGENFGRLVGAGLVTPLLLNISYLAVNNLSTLFGVARHSDLAALLNSQQNQQTRE